MSLRRPEDLPQAFQDAWNAHDMDALGALFHDDATFVNRMGRFVRGRADIVEQHRAIHQTIYSDSVLEDELHACDRVAEQVAIVHFWCRLTIGAAHPAGPHQIDTLILSVLTGSDGDWAVKAVENVTLTDPTGKPILRG